MDSPSKFNEELQRLRRLQYASETDENAVKLAHDDMLSAPDFAMLPPGFRGRCKMHATDVLRIAAELAPALLTDEIIQDCQRVFADCNDASRINIIRIFGLLGRKDAVSFLEQVRDDRTRPNVCRPVQESGRHIMKSFRDDSQPDWVADEAVEALAQIRNSEH